MERLKPRRELWRYTSPYRGLEAMEEKDSDYFFGFLSWVGPAGAFTTATRSSWEIVAKALVDHLVQVGRLAPPRWAKGA